MIRFVVSRTAGLLLVLLSLTLALFVLRQATGGDPAKQVLGANASPEALAEVRKNLWLDRPLPAQFVHYLGRLIHGDLGISLRTQRPVTSDLAQYLPPSVALAVLAMIVATIGGVLLGMLSASAARGSRALSTTLIGLASVPSFLLGLLAIILFYATLQWLPASGQGDIFDAPTGPTHVVLVDGIFAGRADVVWDAVLHLILPVLVLAVGPAIAIARVFRSSLTSTLSADYIRTARSKGLPERTIVRRHALRNSSGPAMAMAGLQVGGLFAALAVVEVIFAWPGIGGYVAQSIPAGDFPGVAGVTLVVGVAYVLTNSLVDFLQAVADPRIRL